jgi:hypothetical protein
MPQESQLDSSKTFESQEDLVVKTIIPTLKQLLDPVVYPISEDVIYKTIYRRHRSRRDTYRISKKPEAEKKKELIRKHKNTRRSEVNKYAAKCLFSICLILI